MLTSEIIEGFEQYVDDTTELAPAQELALANKIYRRILNMRPWEFLKKAHSVAVSGLTCALPADFAYMTDNYAYTDQYMPSQGGKVVFIVSPQNVLKPVELVNWSDRYQYANDDVCYVDILAGSLVFTKQQTAGHTLTFDYIHNPADLTLATSPIFPARFHEMIYHGMAVEDYVCQQFPKAQSYASENAQLYKGFADDMSYWNAQLVNMS